MALMALPLAGLDAQPARAIWLIVSLIVFIAGVAALVKYQALRNRDVSIPVLLLMLLSPAVFTNLRIGQGYLIVFALFDGNGAAVDQRTRSRRGRGSRRAARDQDERPRDRSPVDRAEAVDARWQRRASPRRSS